MTQTKSKLFVKFCAYVIVMMLMILLFAYVTAERGIEFLGEIFGGSGLIVWLVLVTAGAISAFFVRKKIWGISFTSALILALVYSFVIGLTFSPALLGYSGRTILQVTVPTMMMFGLTGAYAWIKNDENFAVMLAAGAVSALMLKFLTGASWAACFISFIGCLIMIFYSAWNSPQAHRAKKESAAMSWAVSVFLGVLMMLAFWVLIWGTWDTTKRRYDKNLKGGR